MEKIKLLKFKEITVAIPERKKEMEKQLVLKRQRKKAKGFKVIHVSEEVFDELSEMKNDLNLPMSNLVDTLIEYALSNVVIED